MTTWDPFYVHVHAEEKIYCQYCWKRCQLHRHNHMAHRAVYWHTDSIKFFHLACPVTFAVLSLLIMVNYGYINMVAQ